MRMNDSAAVAGPTCVHQRILYYHVHRRMQICPTVDKRQIGSAQTQTNSSGYRARRALDRLRGRSSALKPDLRQTALASQGGPYIDPSPLNQIQYTGRQHCPAKDLCEKDA